QLALTVTAEGGLLPAVPTVDSLQPTCGPPDGGTMVTITGTNLTSDATVAFGAAAAGGVTVDSTTQITAISPPGTGTVDVRVTTAGGTSAIGPGDVFTFPCPAGTTTTIVTTTTIPSTSTTTTTPSTSTSTTLPSGCEGAATF